MLAWLNPKNWPIGGPGKLPAFYKGLPLCGRGQRFSRRGGPGLYRPNFGRELYRRGLVSGTKEKEWRGDIEGHV